MNLNFITNNMFVLAGIIVILFFVFIYLIMPWMKKKGMIKQDFELGSEDNHFYDGLSDMTPNLREMAQASQEDQFTDPNIKKNLEDQSKGGKNE